MKKFLTTALLVVVLSMTAFAGYVYYINQPLPQDENDVVIIERTIELLSDETQWSKEDDRTCGPEKDGVSLYCALRQASIDVTGEFRHRAAALQEVRYAIQRATPGVEYAHRLMDYNNSPATSFEGMHAVLRDALDRLHESGG